MQLKIKKLYLMRRFFNPLCLLFSTVLILASCLESNKTEVTLYDDIAITTFGISSAKTYKHTISSTGSDSVYSDMDGTVSQYPFHIDQLRGEIYNTDSLPVGVDASKMLCTYSTMNSGLPYLENITGDSLMLLSTTDTIDFSAPRYIRVYAMDNSGYRKYKVTVNVHKENGNEFHWNRMADCAQIAALSGMKAVSTAGRLLVFGTDGNTTKIYSTDISGESTWNVESTEMGAEAWRNIAITDNKVYVLDNSMLTVSADGGHSFNSVGECTGISRLLGGNTTALYALGTDGGILMSADGGQTWQADMMGDDTAWMPTDDIGFCCTPFRYNAGTDYLVLTGNRSVEAYPNDRSAMVWRKISEYTPDSKAGKWIYMSMDDTDIYPLPRLSGITVLGYGNSLLALGGNGIGACHEEAMKYMYESRDGGITWKPSASYPLPQELDREGMTIFSAATDADNNIWIVCGGTGQVWRGRLNKMGWNE